MANVFQMIKQAASMQKEFKRVQKELAKKIVESSSDGVTVIARGDMSIDNISIDPAVIDLSKPERLEKAVASAVNGALGAAKKLAGGELSKMTGGLGGLSDLLGS